MTVVGVTGRYCAGKDTVTRLLVDMGYHEINVDRLGHSAVDRLSAKIVEEFGAAILGPDGAVDRARLGEVVFGRIDSLRRLESIVHPAMIQMVLDAIGDLRTRFPQAPGIVVNAAVLFRMALDHYCDMVLFVRAPFLARVRRARQRDGASTLSTIRRLRSQSDVDPQFSTSNADICSVQNDGTVEDLRAKLARHLGRS